jgi:hypothetical protein
MTSFQELPPLPLALGAAAGFAAIHTCLVGTGAAGTHACGPTHPLPRIELPADFLTSTFQPRRGWPLAPARVSGVRNAQHRLAGARWRRRPTRSSR